MGGLVVLVGKGEAVVAEGCSMTYCLRPWGKRCRSSSSSDSSSNSGLVQQGPEGCGHWHHLLRRRPGLAGGL